MMSGTPQPSSLSPNDFESRRKQLEITKLEAEIDRLQREAQLNKNWWFRTSDPTFMSLQIAAWALLVSVITVGIGSFAVLTEYRNQSREIQNMKDELHHQLTLADKAAEQQAIDNALEANNYTLDIKRFKAEFILSALRTGNSPDDSAKAAANLVLLHDADVLDLPDDLVEQLKTWRSSSLPGLPTIDLKNAGP
jgi:hypothetical protein